MSANSIWPLSESERREIIQGRPSSPAELHLWIRAALGLDIPRTAVCAEHNAPFDYVKAAFFEEFSDATIWANRGGGKTLLGAVVTLLDAIWKDGIAIRILGGSLEQSQKMNRYLRRMLLPNFAGLLLGGGRRAPGMPSPLTERTVRLLNGSEIEVLAQSERSVRGNRVQKMRCDEVELFDPDVWTSCQLVSESRDCGRGPTAVGARGAVEAFSTLHRPHGLMQQVVDDARRRGSPLFRWCVLDVLENCPASRPCEPCPLAADCGGRAKTAGGFYRIDDAIVARQRVSRDTWEAEMLCLRPSRRGSVFPMFDRRRHVQPLRPTPGWPIYRAIDFGFANPFVCLWAQVSPGGDVHVLREYQRSRTTVAQHAARIFQLDPGPVRATFCDPAGGQADQITGTSARAELKAAGIPTRARLSRITDGLEAIRRLLEGDGQSAPTLRIDPSCERLIAAMEAYRYPDAGAGPAAETPLKDGVHDHPIDALRYLLINLHHIARSTLREHRY